MHPTTSPDNPTAAPLAAGRPAAPGVVTRNALLRALLQAVGLVAVLGVGVGAALFYGDGPLPPESRAYYVAGLVAAGFAAFFTVWLHGRFAAAEAPAGDPARVGHLVRARLQGLLAAAFGVKLFVLVLGVLFVKRFPLGDEPAKFVDVATFGVTFAGAALLCQLVTAFALARSLRRRPAPAARP